MKREPACTKLTLSALALIVTLTLGPGNYTAHAQLPLAETNWDASVSITAATGEETTNSFLQVQTWSFAASLSKPVFYHPGGSWTSGTLEYGFGVTPVFVQSKVRTMYGGGFEPVIFRWSSARHLGSVQPYIELAGGGLATTANLPPGDTSSFNFTARGGGGINIVLQRQRALDIGFRWAHISNANLGTRNPEFNGLQLSLGYHWFW